jgi:predicted peroxiredoxin
MGEVDQAAEEVTTVPPHMVLKRTIPRGTLVEHYVRSAMFQLCLWTITAIVVCSTISPAMAKPLSGSVQKHGLTGATRIARPGVPQLSGDAHQAESGAKVQSNDFNLHGEQATTAPSWPVTLGTEIRSTSLKPLIETSPKPEPETNGGGGSTTAIGSPVPAPATNQLIIVRLTYHMLDEKNVFKASKMCLALRSTGCDVMLMLDKEATRIASKHLATQYADRNENRTQLAREALEKILNAGCRVVAAQDWANDFGVDEGSAVSGVELMSTDELAAEIVHSSKILEY